MFFGNAQAGFPFSDTSSDAADVRIDHPGHVRLVPRGVGRWELRVQSQGGAPFDLEAGVPVSLRLASPDYKARSVQLTLTERHGEGHVTLYPSGIVILRETHHLMGIPVDIEMPFDQAFQAAMDHLMATTAD